MRVLQLRRRKNNSALYVTVRRLCFNADGTILAASIQSTPGLVAVEVHSGRVPEVPSARVGLITCAAYSRSGEYLALGGSDGRARPYRIANGVPLAELMPGPRSPAIREVTFAPTTDPASQWLAVCGIEFWLWNPFTQQYLVAPEQESFIGAAFDSAVESVAVLSGVGVTRFRIRPFQSLWHMTLERLTGRLTHPQTGRLAARVCATDSVLVIGDGIALHIIEYWSGEWRDTIRLMASMTDLAFLPNSRLLAVADGSPTLRVYDTDTGTLAREYDWGVGGIHCVTFSNDGAMGAAGGDKGRVVVWDVD